MRLCKLAQVSGNPAIFARGIGLIIFTSARLNREAADVIRYTRFIFVGFRDTARYLRAGLDSGQSQCYQPRGAPRPKVAQPQARLLWCCGG